MSKKPDNNQNVSDLYQDLDLQVYADSYDQINRTKPRMAQTLVRLVTAGETPADIKARHIRQFPTSFLQAQAMYEAARYIEHAGLELD